MSLTPEEQRAVEFAMEHWLSRRACDIERSRLYQEVVRRVRAQRYGHESAESAADYAIGAHDGYRRGVEACIAALWERTTREEYGHAKAAVCLDIEACRALLAQEESRG